MEQRRRRGPKLGSGVQEEFMPRPNITPQILVIKAGPGESRNATLSIHNAPVDTGVTATIQNGSGLITLKEVVAFEKSVRPMTEEEINELPPFPPSIREKARREGVVDYTEFGRTDGITPLSVPADASVEFHLVFLASPESISNLVNASLVITAAAWDRVEVPIHFLVGNAITIPAVAPDTVNVVAEPGQAQTYDVIIASAPSSTAMLAYVEDGGAIIGVKQAIAFRTIKKEYTEEEINELPPSERDKARRDGYIEYQEAARSLGSTPLAVEKNQLVKISVEFAPPLQGFPDAATATLVIDAPVWQTTRVPLSLIVGKIAVSLSTDSITANKVLGADMTVTLTSVAGPATDVNLGLGMGSDQWRVVPDTVHLPQGSTITVPVKVVPSSQAPLGTFPVGFEVRSFEHLQFLSIPFNLTVLMPAVSVRLLQSEIAVLPGGRATCQVEVTSSGNEQGTFRERPPLPQGISMPQVQHLVGFGTPMVVPLEIVAGADALAGTNQLVPIRWSADDGVNEGFISVPLTVNRVQVAFDAIVTTPDPEALGGDVHLTIRSDGSYELQVHMHDSGAPDYSFRLGIFLRSTSGIVFALYSRGTVRGSDYLFLHPGAEGFREFHDSQNDFSDVLRDGFAGFSVGSLQVSREWKNNITEWAESLVLEKLTFILGASIFGGPAVSVVWGATTLGDLTGVRLPGELGIAGLIAAEGQYFLAGPTCFVPVFIAGALVSAALFKRRNLHADEKAELERVFKDTLDYNRIMITNLEGLGGRPFTIFNLDGQIVMAASSGIFTDFNNLLTNNLTKRVFVHEMTHAWQYQHKPTLTRLCDIIGTRGDEVLYGQDAVYRYTPGLDWIQDYNMEQQANIVEDWHSVKFNNFFPQGTSRTADTDNDQYIREDILMGRA
jgi:hypothetical protein